MRILIIRRIGWLEWQKDKRLILYSILVLLLFSVIEFVLPLIRSKQNDLELIGRYVEQYTLSYPYLSRPELRIIIFADFKMTVLLISAALISPFLGIMDSICSEKDSRTIENLLVLPLTDAEIINGKMLTCLLAGILLSWLLWLVYFIFLLGYASLPVAFHLVNGSWLLLGLLLVPALALFMNLLGIIIAIRVQRGQTGYNLGFLLMFPFVLLLTMLGLGLYSLTVNDLLIAGGLFSVSDVALLILAYRNFNRERILLKYK
jgi:ABC-type transport system involved in multi-copper enzyme maturation permease subunit